MGLHDDNCHYSLTAVAKIAAVDIAPHTAAVDQHRQNVAMPVIPARVEDEAWTNEQNDAGSGYTYRLVTMLCQQNSVETQMSNP